MSAGDFRSNRLQLHDLELARAARRHHRHGVARLLVDQRLADRRRGGDHALRRVGVLRHHELKAHLLAVAVDDFEGRAEAGTIVGNAIDVDQRDLGHAFLEHADARFDEALPLFRRLVLGVLAQIAELARALDLLRQLELELVVQRVNFVFEFLDQPVFHRLPMDRAIVPQCYPSRVTITSRQNPLVARFLTAARGDVGGVMLLEGAHLVADAVAAAITFQLAAVTPASLERDDVRALADALERRGVEVITVSASVMEAVSPVKTPSGMVALAERPAVDPERLYAGSSPLVVSA